MNAEVRCHSTDIEPTRFQVPRAAWQRLRSRLGQALARGEAESASATYGIEPEALSGWVGHWYEHFEPTPSPLPEFETELDGRRLDFIHLPSSDRTGLPLLLLHGYGGSQREFASLAEPLATSGCHVVCPTLAFSSPASAAAACSELMQRLGYRRYAAHGSDLGANVALELAAMDQERVLALHVTALPAYPSEQDELTPQEKSQLARLSELHQELQFQLPESPLEDLAFALSRLDSLAHFQLDLLLENLTWRWALGSGWEQRELYRASRLAAAPACRAPLVVHDFPLGTPSLRRFAERHHHVLEWHEHAQGGPMPALEQPELLLGSLRTFSERLR